MRQTIMLSGAHSAWKIFYLHYETVILIHHINQANLMCRIHNLTSGCCAGGLIFLFELPPLKVIISMIIYETLRSGT